MVSSSNLHTTNVALVRRAFMAGEGRQEAVELLTEAAWENPQILQMVSAAGIKLDIPNLSEQWLVENQLSESLNTDLKLTGQIRIAYLAGQGTLTFEDLSQIINDDPSLLNTLGHSGVLKNFPSLQKEFAEDCFRNLLTKGQKAVLEYLVKAHQRSDGNGVGRIQILRSSWSGWSGGGYYFGSNDDERARAMEEILNNLTSSHLELVEHAGYWNGSKSFPTWKPTSIAIELFNTNSG